MSVMVERAIDALENRFRESVELSSDLPFAETGVKMPSRDLWRTYAVAVIEAMRVPDDAMREAGATRQFEHAKANIPNVTDAKGIWTAMIDAALK